MGIYVVGIGDWLTWEDDGRPEVDIWKKHVFHIMKNLVLVVIFLYEFRWLKLCGLKSDWLLTDLYNMEDQKPQQPGLLSRMVHIVKKRH